MKKVIVKDLLNVKKLGLSDVTGVGLENEIIHAGVQKPGLLLTPELKGLHTDRVQILGLAEIDYFTVLSHLDAEKMLKKFDEVNVPLFVITRDMSAPPELLEYSKEKNIALFSSKETSSQFIARIIKHLEEQLSPTETLHGVLVDVLGIGVLIKGKSGIGKSECALELVTRGHRMVADDAVVVSKTLSNKLLGRPSSLIKYHIEVRGIGIINMKDIFGITAIREEKYVDMVLELVEWNSKEEYERLGFEDQTFEILEQKVAYYKIPVSPSRSTATIIEVAARNYILKLMGYDSTKEFRKKLDASIQGGVE